MMTAEAIMQFEIEGELAQVAHLTLDKGESCWASKGSLVSIDPGLGWTLKLPGGLGALGRELHGQRQRGARGRRHLLTACVLDPPQFHHLGQRRRFDSSCGWRAQRQLFLCRV